MSGKMALGRKCLTTIIAVLLATAAFMPVYHAGAAEEPFTMAFTINHIDRLLPLLDDLAREVQAGKSPAVLPGAMLNSMLKGTDWIDTRRPIVLGVNMSGRKNLMAALVPFSSPNDTLRDTFKAVSGPDYYIVSLPPGQGRPIPEAAVNQLVELSRKPGKDFLALTIALARMLRLNESQIALKLSKLENLPQIADGAKSPLSSKDLAAISRKMLSIGHQVDSLRLSMNMDQKKVSMGLALKAVGDSSLERLLTPPATPAFRLSDLKINADMIAFQSRAYNVGEMMQALFNVFGPAYRKMGLDLAGLMTLCQHFTGEMKGGVSFKDGHMAFEMVGLLTQPDLNGDFIEKQYLPWLKDYNKNLVATLAAQSGETPAAPYVQTAPSMVAGHKVSGVRIQMPVTQSMAAADIAFMKDFMDYEMRMTTVGDLFISASDDAALGRLIRESAALEPRPAQGPLMTVDMDLGAYLKLIAQMAGNPDVGKSFAGLGRLSCNLDLAKGRAVADWNLNRADIRRLIAGLQQIQKAARSVAVTAQSPPKAAAPASPPPPRLSEKDSRYWQELGDLCSTYGNYKGALRHYRKAKAIDPHDSYTYFQMGVAYAELRQIPASLAAFDQALAIAPDNGAYYYGKGRTYLLDGQFEKSRAAMRSAARLGNDDATAYLKKIHVSWE